MGQSWRIGGAGRKGLSWGRMAVRTGAVVLSAGLLVGLAGPASPSGAQPLPALSAKVDPGIGRSSGRAVSVIVQAWPGQVTQAANAVKAQRGTVGVALPVVDGFQATISGGAIEAVASSTAVKAITANRQGHFAGFSSAVAASASASASPASSSGAPASGSEFVKSTGAAKAWAAGDFGAGVGVAVIDTGLSNMDDLAGRITWGPDLSGEGTTIDSYGHGTVMAGLIGGDGTDSAASSAGPRTGIAPRANLIAVKTAGYNGTADVSTILQAMHWVSAYQAQFNIRVVNLSWGTPSTQSPSIDPLDYAVERLWNQGIVVVVAAGNGGPTAASITKPGDDPMVLTVGAFNDRATPPVIPAWSSRGPTAAGIAKPDLVAPGRTLIATRSYGSNVETNNPNALISPSYITGSGTSEATAVTSGLAALLIAAHPTYTADQVKAVLRGSADRISGYQAQDQGAGRINLAEALVAAPGPAEWQASPATGLGSLEASRGGIDLTTVCNGVSTVITGEIDARCQAWNPAAWAGTSWTGTSWTGTSWTGTSWTGTSWTGTSWTGGTWTGTSWTGTSWTGTSWTGTSWTGTSWTGTSWTGTSWTGTSWTNAFWGPQPRRGQRLAGERSAGGPDPATI